MGYITIDGSTLEYFDNETILDVARRNDIYIPVMCFLKEITPTGACRLCLVEIETVGVVASCTTYVSEGMVINTNTPEVLENRKAMLEFILLKHPLDCPVCDKGGECTLQDLAFEFGITEENISLKKPNRPVLDWEMIIYDGNLCVLCERCVKVCHEITGCSALKIDGRGYNSIITSSNGKNLDCDFCGICVDVCPVGALLDKSYKHKIRPWDLESKMTVCAICPVGCKVEYDIHDNKILRGKSTKDSYICSLGRYGYNYLYNPVKLKNPVVNFSGGLIESKWKEAMEILEQRIRAVVEKFGKDSIAVIVGSRLSNEAIYNYLDIIDGLGSNKIISDLELNGNKFFNYYKKFIGTYHSIGSLENIKKSDLIFVIGSDLASEAVGIKWEIIQAVVGNGANLYTIGLKKYEYDSFTKGSLLADYGDFANIFEKIKNSKDKLFTDIRSIVEKADNITVVIGNEYIFSEADLESVFSFLQFIDYNKIMNLFPLNEKANFMGMLNSGIYDNGYSAENLIKDVRLGKVKCLISADFYPSKTSLHNNELLGLLDSLECIVVVDMFRNSFSEKADFIIPVLSPMEKAETYTTIDGYIIKTDVVVKNNSLISDVKMASIFGGILSTNIHVSAKDVWDKNISIKSGHVNIKFEELKRVFLDREFSIKKINYKYKKAASRSKKVYVNSRHHNGLLSTFADIMEQDNPYSRKYFSFDNEILYPDDKENLARGVVLVPKNNL